jgi:hypothetical protein
MREIARITFVRSVDDDGELYVEPIIVPDDMDLVEVLGIVTLGVDVLLHPEVQE